MRAHSRYVMRFTSPANAGPHIPGPQVAFRRSMRRNWLRLTQTLLVGSLLAASCADEHARNTEDSPDDRPTATDACSTGPVHDVASVFPEGTEREATVTCVPHCGEEKTQPWFGDGIPLYGISAVPSGTCEHGTPPCSMDVGHSCCENVPIGSQWFIYYCTCKDDTWSCERNYKGGGACLPSACPDS